MERDPLEFLMADPEVTSFEKVIFWWLWRWAGGRPDHRVVNKLDLARAAACDPRSVERALKRLHTLDLIEIGEWDKLRGAIEVYIRWPSRGKAEPRPEPQNRLDFTSDSSPDSTPSGGAPDSTPSGGAPDSTPSGGAPDSTPSGAPPNSTRNGRPPQEGMDRNAQTGPTPVTKTREIPVRPPPRLDRNAQTSPAHRLLFNEFKEREIHNSPKYQSTSRFNEFIEGRRGAQTSRGGEPEAIGGTLTDVLLAAAKLEDHDRPAIAKPRLMDEIAEAAGLPLIDPETGRKWWVAGAGADLVIDGHCAYQVLQGLLRELKRRRAALPPSHIGNPGGWLQHRLAQIAREAGIRWGKRHEAAP